MMAQYTVSLMGSADRARWDAFVQQCPAATFFHRAGWQEVIEEGFSHPTWFMYAEKDGTIQAVLPLAQIKSRLFGNTLCSLPFCVYGGIASLAPDAAAAVDAAAQRLAARLRVDHLEYRQRDAGHADWLHGSLYATFRKPLADDPEENLLAIPRKQRAAVRKGIASRLVADTDDDIGRFFSSYATSLRNHGTPTFSPRYFSLLRRVFGEDCQLLSVSLGLDHICSVLSFRFRDEILPYYAGGDSKTARALAAHDFMYWELMRRACLAGSRLFDFGRSKYGTGSFSFKKNWGFEPQPLHYAYQLHRGRQLRDVQPLNPRYQLLIKAWRLLPLPLANAIGPCLVRQLG